MSYQKAAAYFWNLGEGRKGMKIKKYRGIAGVEGKENVFAALSLGRKPKGGGFPIERDRFHFVKPREADGVRDYHPSYKAYNEAPPENRRILYGNIVHATEIECFEWHRKKMTNQQGKMHPNKFPFCIGDGISATRWMGGDEFKEIECPNEKCEFAMSTDPAKKCNAWMRFLFRIRWPNNEFPAGIIKFTTGSWNAIQSFVGFFESFMRTANHLGIKQPSLFGVPFTLTLDKGTKPSIQAKFYSVSITNDIDPLEFFRTQKQLLAQIADTGTKPIALIDAPEQDAQVVFEDWKQISVPSNMPVQIKTPAKSKTEPTIPEKPPQDAPESTISVGDDDKIAKLESFRQAFAAQNKEKQFFVCLKNLKVEFGKVPEDRLDFVIKQIKNFAKGQKVNLE